MHFFSFLHKHKNKEPSALIEERLLKVQKDAYRQATMQLARGNIDLMTGNWVTREWIDAELKSVAEDFDKLDKNV